MFYRCPDDPVPLDYTMTEGEELTVTWERAQLNIYSSVSHVNANFSQASFLRWMENNTFSR